MLHKLPDDLFKHTPKLEVIEMQDISYPESISVLKLPEGFENIINLRNLTMTAFDMRNITRDFFSNLHNRSSLIHLSLAGNSIAYIEPKSFDGLDKLSNLSIDINLELPSVHFNTIMSSLPNLQYVSCHLCSSLHYLNRSTFAVNTKLRVIDLSASSIEFIEPFSFSALSNLEELRLYENQIQFCGPNTFAGVETSLLYLDISANDLQDITWSTANMSQLKYLDLAANHGLDVLYPNATDGLYQVEELHISECGLNQVSNGSFRDMHSLRVLYLSGNYHLITLGVTAFKGLYNIRELILGGTSVLDLHNDQFVDMPLLTSLIAYRLGVTHLPGGLFRNNPLLSEIFLSSSRISRVGVTFKELEFLQTDILKEIPGLYSRYATDKLTDAKI